MPLYAFTGQYKALSCYVGSRALYELSARTGLTTLLLAVLSWSMGWPELPRSSWVLFWFLLTGLSGPLRFALRDVLLGWQRRGQASSTAVVIYGAGAAGAQLAGALRFGQHHSSNPWRSRWCV